MKKIFFILCFLFSTELCLAHKDSTYNVPQKMWVLSENTAQKDTLNDGWNDDSWSPEPRQKTPEEIEAEKQREKADKQAKKAERKAQRKQAREDNPSYFPRGVAWSSVALALIGLGKMWLNNCK